MARSRKSETGETGAAVDPAGDATPVEIAEPVAEQPIEESLVPRAEEKVAVAPPAPVRRRGGFWPLVLGGVVAAGIGAGATVAVLPQLPQGLRDRIVPAATDVTGAISAQTAEIAALKAELQSMRSTLDAPDPLAGTIQALESDLRSTISTAADRLTGVESTLSGLTEQADAFDARLTTLEKRPVSGGAASATAIEAISREMEDMRRMIDENPSVATSAQGEITAAAEEAAKRIAEAEAEAQRLRAEAELAAQAVSARAAVSHLRAALENGSSLEAPLADLAASGITVPAALADQAGGVPSQQALESSFLEAAREALALSIKETAGTGALDQIGAFLRSQTGARSLTPREGTDPDAVLSRAEAALGAGDLAMAIAELDGLPASGKARMAEWIGLASRRQAALDAAAALAETVR